MLRPLLRGAPALAAGGAGADVGLRVLARPGLPQGECPRGTGLRLERLGRKAGRHLRQQHAAKVVVQRLLTHGPVHKHAQRHGLVERLVRRLRGRGLRLRRGERLGPPVRQELPRQQRQRQQHHGRAEHGAAKGSEKFPDHSLLLSPRLTKSAQAGIMYR